MIQEILQKLGIKSIDDLKPSDRATYIQWSAPAQSCNYGLTKLSNSGTCGIAQQPARVRSGLVCDSTAKVDRPAFDS